MAVKKSSTAKSKKATKTTTAKKTASSKRSASKKNGSRSWKIRVLRYLVILGFKFALIGIAISLVVGIYLDQIIKDKFQGQMWQLPATVYGRVLDLKPGMDISKRTVVAELKALKYLKVIKPIHPGEYAVSATRIELIRRPFDFVEGPEPANHVSLEFAKTKLVAINKIPSYRRLQFLKIEPQMLGMLNARSSDEQRIFIPREQFPEVLIDALLATEDRNFFHHDGVSIVSILRALVANLKAGHTVQGGSTLTQQLAKNLFLTTERTLWRKLRELYIAVIIDHRYSKDRIIEAYLNEVYLGQSRGDEIHGFGLAARLYFGRPINELEIQDIALLVGLVKGPSYYNPWRYSARARERRDLVLKLMLKQNILTPRQFERAALKPLGIQKHPKLANSKPAYFQLLKAQLRENIGSEFRVDTGLRVFSTLDPVAQTNLEKAVVKTMPILEKKSGKGLQSAAVVADRKTGEIRAMIGGARPGYAGFNRAINASRQIGSLAKPSVYLTALMQPNKYNLATTLIDAPLAIKGDNGKIWSPKNYSKTYKGEVPLYLALAKSMNVPTVNLGMQLGVNAVRATQKELGLDISKIPQVPSIFLGSFTLTPLEVVQMFQTITSGGKKAPITTLLAVVDLDGRVLYKNNPQAERVVDERAAWLTTYIMKKVVTQGTARSLLWRFGNKALAGKTGTTDNYRDSWFVGADGNNVSTFWVGRDDNKPTKLTGSSGALKIYIDYLSRGDIAPLLLDWPKGIKTYRYKTKSDYMSLDEDCTGDIALPVWAIDNKQQKCGIFDF